MILRVLVFPQKDCQAKQLLEYFPLSVFIAGNTLEMDVC